jgi:hypothetical protein
MALRLRRGGNIPLLTLYIPMAFTGKILPDIYIHTYIPRERERERGVFHLMTL